MNKNTLRDFAETFKNQAYASYIHTFSSTESTLTNVQSTNLPTLSLLLISFLNLYDLNDSVSFDHM